ncbi:MAG TPA: hypothetical protein VFG66_00150 [Gemmatimonadales bacterium]|nr:hypothetical protein [Gemmatimonadales bacterium]
MSSSEFRRTLPAVAIWGWLAGCGGDPVGPIDLSPPIQPVSAERVSEAAPATSEAPRAIPQAVRADTAVPLEFTEEIRGLESRFFPTLERPTVVALAAALEQFARAVKADDLAAAAKALTVARAALETGTAAPADLDALRRSIDAMAAAIAPATD